VKDGAEGAFRTGDQCVEQLRRLPALKTEKTNQFLIAKAENHLGFRKTITVYTIMYIP
jgi:hypothetical protein